MKKSIMFATAMIVVAGTLFTKANKETKMSDTVLANVEALSQSEGSETEKIYCCGNVGTCMIVYDSSFNKKEVIGLKFSTPCPQ